MFLFASHVVRIEQQHIASISRQHTSITLAAEAAPGALRSTTNSSEITNKTTTTTKNTEEEQIE